MVKRGKDSKGEAKASPNVTSNTVIAQHFPLRRLGFACVVPVVGFALHFVGFFEKEEVWSEERGPCGEPSEAEDRAQLREAPRTMTVLPAPSIPITEMSRTLFNNNFSGQQTVLITGAMSSLEQQTHWSLQGIVAACPKAEIALNRYEEGSDNWARHVSAGMMNLVEYHKKYFNPVHKKRPDPLLYGFEMPLKRYCPKLLEKFELPAFLTEDAFHYVTEGEGEGWPTVLLGPARTITGLHIDTHRLPFWIAVLGPPGKVLKRMRVFKTDDRIILKYVDTVHKPANCTKTGSSSSTFAFDPWNPDYKKFPMLRLTSVYEAEMRSGDLLYIPHGGPHAAINDEDNLAVSMNYLDLKSTFDFIQHCKCCYEGDDGKGSDLCKEVLHGGYDLIPFFASRRAAAEKPMDYFTFSGLHNRTTFCETHSTAIQSHKYPELERYCEEVRAEFAAEVDPDLD